jgi:hypothetical protein
MTAQVARMCGTEWQQWGNLLLATHYGPTDYQKVPDKHRGDAGIEGFTISSGHAYQAYGCEEPVDTKTRYEKQRDKITEDVGKFVQNRTILERIFGATRITRWVLLVPYFDSREIVVHAARKTAEVREVALPYVGDGFRVVVIDEEHFSIEREQLLNARSNCVRVDVEPATTEQVTGWAAEHDDLFETLDRKIARLPTLRTKMQREEFRDRVLKWYLEGQSILEALRKYPNIYEAVIRSKSHQENYLAMSAATLGPSPADVLRTAFENLTSHFGREAKQLSSLSAESLVHEAVGDWMLRCPLDFPEVGPNA